MKELKELQEGVKNVSEILNSSHEKGKPKQNSRPNRRRLQEDINQNS